jgi:uncharacterized protein (DUF927 family)/phage/plasmid primase-like uncharacterized protein
LTKKEQEGHRREIARAKQESEQARQAAQAVAAKKAATIWKQAKPAKEDHPYLVNKGIKAHGLRQTDSGKLVVPLRDSAGRLYSLQNIDKGGGKRFLPEGRVQGCYFSIGKPGPASGSPVCIVEGFATAASVHQATGFPVAVAFNAGNLKAVAQAIRAKLPEARLILCADDDAATDGNPGIAKATEAAHTVGGFLAVPDFGPNRPNGVSDFNDLHTNYGKEKVAACIEAARPVSEFGEKKAVEKPAVSGEQAPAQEQKAVAPVAQSESPTHHDYGGGRFSLVDGGVYFTGTDKDGNETPARWICSPLHVVAKTRSAASSEWGRLLEWKDDDGVQHTWAMPLELLQGDGGEVRRELARLGLSLSTSKSARDMLATFLQVWPVDLRARCVDRPGWHGAVYVTPSEAIGGEGEKVVFQSAHALAPAWAVAGTVDDWRGFVAACAAGNSRVVFSLSLAFAGSLLSIAGEESGGVHIVGKSSCGKSTIAKVAASVWGNPELYRRQWRGTDNGFEGLASLHNDGLLIMDEIGQADERKVGEATYLFANGQGKQRAGKSGAARSVASWRVLLLSNGEQPLSAIMAKAGKRVNAGQEVRLVHIDADAGAGMGAFENIHNAASPGEFAKLLDDLASKHHGAVGLEWLRNVVINHKALPALVADSIQKFCAAVVPAGASGQVARVARRFGLVAVAGELATSYGLTGWPEGESAGSAKKCFASWLESFGGIGDREEAGILAQVRAFFEAHGSARFEAMDANDDQKVINRAGFWRKTIGDQTLTGGNQMNGPREFLVLPQVFRQELCMGFGEKTAKDTLLRSGLLIPGSNGRPAQLCRLPGIGPTKVYVFRYIAEAGEE